MNQSALRRRKAVGKLGCVVINRSIEVCFSQFCAAEVCPAQVSSAAQIVAAQIGAAKVCIAASRAVQRRTAKIYARKICKTGGKRLILQRNEKIFDYIGDPRGGLSDGDFGGRARFFE